MKGQVSDRGAEKRATCDIAFYPATLSVRPGFLQVKRRKHKGAPSGTRLEACTIPLLYLLYCTTLYRTVLSNQEIVHIHPVPAVLRNVIAYTVRRSGPIPGTEVSSRESDAVRSRPRHSCYIREPSAIDDLARTCT